MSAGKWKYNTRQQLYKKYRIEGCSKYAAARKAGYSHATATQAKHIEKYIDMNSVLEMAGITDKCLAEHAVNGLNAMKLRACDIYVKKGEDGKITFNENSNDFIEVEDWYVRHRYFETILKLRNKLIDKPLIDQHQESHTHYAVIYYDGNGSDKNHTSSRVRGISTPMAD